MIFFLQFSCLHNLNFRKKTCLRKNKNAKALKIHSVILLRIWRFCTFCSTVQLRTATYIKHAFSVNYTVYAYIHTQRIEINQDRHFVFEFTSIPVLCNRHFDWKLMTFEVWSWSLKFIYSTLRNVENWFTIPNLVMSTGSWVTLRPDLSGNPDLKKSKIRAIPDFRHF